jgi:hypothetical protein
MATCARQNQVVGHPSYFKGDKLSHGSTRIFTDSDLPQHASFLSVKIRVYPWLLVERHHDFTLPLAGDSGS